MTLSLKIIVCLAAIGAMILLADPVRGQGSIYGAVTNSDLTVPDSGDIGFY